MSVGVVRMRIYSLCLIAVVVDVVAVCVDVTTYLKQINY